MEQEAKVESMLQQLSVAVEQHHQAYLGQQPLVLMAQQDYDAIKEYYKAKVRDGEESIEGKPMYVFGALAEVSEQTVAGRFLIAKVVYYV